MPKERRFENWLKSYVLHTSNSEAPDAFHFWTGVSTIAGALRRRVWIDELSFKWFPNFYIILVAPAGVVTKTTSISMGMRLLAQVDGVHFGPQSMTWQALAKAMEAAVQDVSAVLPDGRVVTRQTSSLTVAVGEMGTFFKMEDSVMMDVLVSLYDSPDGPWKHQTATTGETKIENPWLNIIACTTPTWVKEHFQESMIGGGLASRMVFVYGDSKRQLIAYPHKMVRPRDYYEQEKRLVEDLKSISTLCGQYVLSDEAIEWGEAWYARHWHGQRAVHMASSRFSGYLSRKQAHMHKLAMILAAAKRNQLVIEREDLQEALTLLESVEPSMGRVFDQIGQVDEARRMKEMVNFVQVYGELQSSQLWNLMQNTITKKDFEATLKIAIQATPPMLSIVARDGKLYLKVPAPSPFLASLAAAPPPHSDIDASSLG